MKKLLKTTIVTLIGLVVLVFVGAGCLQDLITPCYIDSDAGVYADEPLTDIMPYTTILDAKRIDAKMDYVNKIGKLKYVYLKDSMMFHLMDAEQLKQSVFSPDGLLSLLLIGGPSLAVGAMFIPRKRERDLEKQLNGSK